MSSAPTLYVPDTTFTNDSPVISRHTADPHVTNNRALSSQSLSFEISYDPPLNPARPIRQEDLRKITVSCNGRSQEDILRAAACTASIIDARKPGPDKVEFLVELPEEVFQATDGQRGFEQQILRNLRTLDMLNVQTPAPLTGPINGEDREGYLRVRISNPQKDGLPQVKPGKAYGRHVVTTVYKSKRSAARLASTGNMLANARITEKKIGNETVYAVETVPSVDVYIKEHMALQRDAIFSGSNLVHNKLRRLIKNGLITNGKLNGWATDKSSGKRYLRVRFEPPAIHSGSSYSDTEKQAQAIAEQFRQELRGHPMELPVNAMRMIEGNHASVELLIPDQALMELGQRQLENPDIFPALATELRLEDPSSSSTVVSIPISSFTKKLSENRQIPQQRTAG